MLCKIHRAVILLLFSFILLQPEVSPAFDAKINDDEGTGEQSYPDLAINRYGEAVMVWMDERNGNYDIYAQRFSRKGMPLGKNFKINKESGDAHQGDPQVVMDARGHFIVTWYDKRNGDADIYARMYAANGSPTGNEFVVNDETGNIDQYEPDIAMDATGQFIICWIDIGDEQPARIYAQRYRADGSRIGNNIAVSMKRSSDAAFPAVAMNDNGDHIIVWSVMETAGGEIYMQRFNSDGFAQGPNIHVSTDVNQTAGALVPDVAMDTAGKYMIAWHEAVPGTFKSVVARCFDQNDTPRGEFIYVDTVTGGVENKLPAVRTLLTGGYQLAWATTLMGSWDIYTQSFTTEGIALDDAGRVNQETPGQQSAPTIGHDGRNFKVFAWHDSRNGHYDIYAQRQGPNVPLNVTAGSGFNGKIPLSWEPVYGDYIDRTYTIYRSTTAGGPYTAVATVNTAERPFPKMMLDWIDKDVYPYGTFYYVVESDIAESDGFSQEAFATVGVYNPGLYSPWAFSAPAIDGKVEAEEWKDAARIDIANPYADSVFLCIMNDAGHLYIAVQDYNDATIDPFNLLTIAFDEENDNRWPTGSSGDEGALLINKDGTAFSAYRGEYPNDFATDVPIIAEGVQSIIENSSGHLEYEIAIDLYTGPIDAAPSSTLGFGMWLDDPGNFYPSQYGNSGAWPQGALWASASTLGDLKLAPDPAEGIVGTPIDKDHLAETIDVRDMDHDNRDELVVMLRNQNVRQGLLILYEWDGVTLQQKWQSQLQYGYPYGFQIIDLNNDTYSDILLSCEGLQYFENSETGFKAPVCVHQDIFNDDFVVHDWNQDGLPDLAAGSPYSNGGRAAVYQQEKGNPAFIIADSLDVAMGNNMLKGGDFDNDGLMDLLCAELYSGEVYVLGNKGGFDFERLFNTDFGGDRVFGIGVSDLNRDDYDDFVINFGSGNPVQIFKNNKNGTFSVITPKNAITRDNGKLYIADVDNNDYQDIIVPGLFTGDVHVIFNYGDFELKDEYADHSPLKTINGFGTGDINNDRKTDFALGSTTLYTMMPATDFFAVPSRVEVAQAGTPQNYNLHQNHPNPFNATTRIGFDIAKAARVEIELFDVLGRRVKTLVRQHYTAGNHSITFKATGLASGVYFYRLKTGTFMGIKKMVLIE